MTLNDRLGYFTASPAYYFILRDYVQRNYALVRRLGRYDVLARRDLLARAPRTGGRRVLEGEVLDGTFAQRRLRARSRRGAPHRRERNARRLRRRGATAGGRRPARPPGGRGRRSTPSPRATRRATTAIERVIATSRSEHLLFLRTLGEYGAPPALGYLQDVFLRTDGRIRWEAARSINFLLARALSARFNLIEPAQGPLVPLPDDLASDALVAPIGDDFAERQRIGPLAALAIAGAQRQDLKQKIDGPWDRRETTWWKMLAAYALVRLGDTRPAADAVRADERGHAARAVRAVDPARSGPGRAGRRRGGARRAAAATAAPRSARRPPGWYRTWPSDAAWPAVEAAVQDPDPRVAHAARWALERRGVAPAAE